MEKVAVPFAQRFVIERPLLRRLARRIARRIEPMLPEAGYPISHVKLASDSVFYSFVFLSLVPISVVLAVTVHPLALLLAGAPLACLAYPTLYLKSVAGDRKRSLEEETPHFAVYATVMQSSNVGMYRAMLDAMKHRDVFRQVGKESSIAWRAAALGSADPVQAVEEVGKSSTNPKFQNLLLGYTSEVRSGGDVGGFLEAKTAEYLRDARARWKHYTDAVGTLGEVFLTVLFVLPMLTLTTTFLAPASAMAFARLFLCAGIPSIVAVGVLTVRGIQPKSYDQFDSSAPLAIAIAVLVGAGLHLGGAPAWCVVAGIIAAGALAYGILIEWEVREIGEHEEGVLRFLRDVTEYHKMGSDLPTAIRRLAQEGKYNPPFASLLKNVAGQLAGGILPDEVRVRTRSWLTKISFFHLLQLAKVGGYSPRSLEMLTEFMSEVKWQKSEAKRAMGLYRVLALFTPLGLGITMGLMMGVFAGFASIPVAGATGFAGLEVFQGVPPDLRGLCEAITIASAAGVCMVTSYAADFTAKRTTLLAAGMLLAVVGILLGDPISTAVSSAF